MPFTEGVKAKAKEHAHYRCVMCQTPVFLEVHHIVPESEQGPDTIDNAASLCPNCHRWFAHDPAKRKEVRAKRDWWWERCAKIDKAQMTTPDGQRFDELLQRYQASQALERQQLFSEMKAIIADQFRQRADEASSASTMKDLVTSSSPISHAHVADNGYLNIQFSDHCPRCGGLLGSEGVCPRCNP